MASTTALTLVNRLLRRHGFEDYSAFTAPETLLALDLVNQAIYDLCSMRAYPWLISTDGTAITTKAPITGTNTATVSGTTVTITGFTGTISDLTSTSIMPYIKFTGGSHPNAQFRINFASLSGTTLTLALRHTYPGSESNVSWKLLYHTYILSDVVQKVLTARHLDSPIRLAEIDGNRTFHEFFPNPDTEGEPEIIMVGGTAASTVEAGDTSTAGLRVMIYPIPDAARYIQFTVQSRPPPLTATTTTLFGAPQEFVDDVIDRAEALSNMTQRFNAPELAQIQMRNSLQTAERKWGNSVLDPNRRHSLRPHDAGARRRDPTSYKDITGL